VSRSASESFKDITGAGGNHRTLFFGKSGEQVDAKLRNDEPVGAARPRRHNLDAPITVKGNHRGLGVKMINREMMEEYRRMNSVDRSAFHRWLITNTVFGAIASLH
jgi:hypothetical protein